MQCRKSVGLATRTLELSDNHTAVPNNVQADNQAADRDTNWCRRKRAKARAREQQRERCNHQCEEKKAKSNVVDRTLCAGGGNQQVTTRGRYPKDNGHPDRPRRKRSASHGRLTECAAIGRRLVGGVFQNAESHNGRFLRHRRTRLPTNTCPLFLTSSWLSVGKQVG